MIGAASTGKAVRFSDSSPEPSHKDDPSSSATKQSDCVVSASEPSAAEADAANPCSSQDGAVSVSLTRFTRSGRLLGVTSSESVIPSAVPEANHAHHDSHLPLSLSEAQCVSGNADASNNTRTTRSGRLFAAKPDGLPPNSISHSAHETADMAAASQPGAVQPESTSAEARAVPHTASVVTDAALGEAAQAAAGGSLSQPWERPLLGMGLPLGLPEEARWADQGRPSTDHPRHKTKSASVMRRCVHNLCSFSVVVICITDWDHKLGGPVLAYSCVISVY